MQQQFVHGRRTMVDACLISLAALLMLFPAPAFARTTPGTLSIGTTASNMERTPLTSGAQANDELAAETRASSSSTGSMDFRKPQEVDSIFDFHSSAGASISSSRRRGLVGSSPPTCRFRCGACAPCKAVHIAIGSPHGVISETEYYPEVWRCQCGNRLYMP